jgi:hypothetical protein
MPAGGVLSTEQLLSELRTLDIRLSVDGDRLRCSAPKGRLTRELKRELLRTSANSFSRSAIRRRRPRPFHTARP